MAQFSFSYEEYDSISSLSAMQQLLIKEAITIAKQAYAPYSSFHVGCAVQLSSNKIIKGGNVENASYPVGICAERTALSFAISNQPNDTITRMAISYQTEDTDKGIIFPCGMCRQFILECQDKQTNAIEILLHSPSGKVVAIQDAHHLLPFGFSGKMLE